MKFIKNNKRVYHPVTGIPPEYYKKNKEEAEHVKKYEVKLIKVHARLVEEGKELIDIEI